MKDLMELNEKEFANLMYNISRSGRVVIPTYYLKDHIEYICDSEISSDEMVFMQHTVEQFDDLTDLEQMHVDYKVHRNNVLEEILEM